VPSGAVVLVDTGPLVALFDPSDSERSRCEAELARLKRNRLVTSIAVITEATQLLDFSTAAQSALLAAIAAGMVEVLTFERLDLARAAELMRKYHDLPMDFADATLVLLAERLDTTDIFTLDRRDFGVYRVGRRRFQLRPSSRASKR
jgi:predicted nucleic acid-binding protein